MEGVQLDHTAVSWRLVDGEIVAVDLRASEYLTVNGAGRILWLELADGADEASLVEALMRDMHVTRAAAEQDVEAFLGSLRARNLLAQFRAH